MRTTEKPADSTENAGGDFTEGRPPFLISVISVLIIGLLIIPVFALQAANWKSFASITALGITVAGAALLVGALTGFLFGIPRSLQQDASASSGDDVEEDDGFREGRRLYIPNTNLEQISDWLTKILVGVGLTQIGSLGGVMQTVSTLAAPGFGNFVASGTFAVALIVYFLVSGFLVGYLWTRLFLGQALAQSERALSLKKQLSKIEKQSIADAKALRLTGQQLTGGEDDLPTKPELRKAIKEAARFTRSHIFHRAQGQRWKTWKIDATKPAMARTIPIFRALIARDTQNKFHANHGQLGFALKDKLDPDWLEAEKELSLAIDIRQDAHDNNWHIYEFNRAICRIELDPAINGSQSDSKTKAEILDDLRVAVEDDWVFSLVEEDSTINKWLENNELNITDLNE